MKANRQEPSSLKANRPMKANRQENSTMKDTRKQQGSVSRKQHNRVREVRFPVDDPILDDPKISVRELRVYSVLSSYANKDGECWPKREAIANRLGIHKPDVSKTIRKLVNKGHVHTSGNGGRSRPNTYTLPYIANKRHGLEPGTTSSLSGWEEDVAACEEAFSALEEEEEAQQDSEKGSGRGHRLEYEKGSGRDERLQDQKGSSGEPLKGSGGDYPHRTTQVTTQLKDDPKQEKVVSFTGSGTPHLAPAVEEGHAKGKGVSIGEVSEAYNSLLPELKPFRVVTGEYRRWLTVLQHTIPEAADIHWWVNVFLPKVRRSPFLMGKKGKFQATLGWLLKDGNAAKVLNGEYDERNVSKRARIARTEDRQKEVAK